MMLFRIGFLFFCVTDYFYVFLSEVNWFSVRVVFGELNVNECRMDALSLICDAYFIKPRGYLLTVNVRCYYMFWEFIKDLSHVCYLEIIKKLLIRLLDEWF